jgi:hypothetical protein
VFVSINDGLYNLWNSFSAGETEWMFYGDFDSCYAFYSIGIDYVGFVEEVPAEPDASICFIDSYDYLPGDANMPNGIWPPAVIGADVTYLVNYFRAISGPCLLDDFYCSADVNGDCLVIGSDVTRLVNYFRGLSDIVWCPDYEPCWPTPDDLPADMPSGWPNCEVVTNRAVVPGGAIGK